MGRNRWGSFIVIIIVSIIIWLIACNAHAASVKVDGGYNDIISSKYGDAWVGSVRVEQDVVENRYGRLALAGEYTHVGESYHPHSGWLRGNGFLGEVVYRPWRTRLEPYAFAGIGFYMWDWRNSEYLDTAGISVELEDEVGYKGGIGVDYHLDTHWAINAEVYYYGSEYEKEEYYADGTQSHTLGDRTLGNEGVCVVGGLRYTF